MAIAFAQMKIVGASYGTTATGTSAYIAADEIQSEVVGRKFNFTWQGGKLLHTSVLLPEGASETLRDPKTLWNLVETTEHKLLDRYKPGMREYMAARVQYAKHLILALPRDGQVSKEDFVDLAQSFVQQHFVSKGLAAQIAIHIDDENNPHAHILLTTRRVRGEQLDKEKARDLNPQMVRGLVTVKDYWGHKWGKHQNNFFLEQGIDLRVDPVGMVKQIHLGPSAKHGNFGEAAFRDQLNQDALAEARDAVRKNPGAVLEKLTDQYARFTEDEIGIVLHKMQFGPQEVSDLTAKVLADEKIVRLKTLEDGSSNQWFSTVEQHRHTREIMGYADLAAERERGHAISQNVVNGVLQDRKNFDRAAVEYLTDAGDLKFLVGRAGTGKSATVAAAKDVFAAGGFRVVGAAPTNSVTSDLNAAGIQSRTVDQWIYGFKRADRYRSELAAKNLSQKTFSELQDYASRRQQRAQASRAEAEKALAAIKGEGNNWFKLSDTRRKQKISELQATIARNAAIEERFKGFEACITEGRTTPEYLAWRSNHLANEIDRLELKQTDVLVLDEAGMVSASRMAALAREVDRAKAKFVQAGDERQLEAIEAGSPFRDLLERHSFYELREVFRQRDAEDRKTSELLADNKMGEAFKRFEAKGRIRFAPDEDAAKKDTVSAWHLAKQAHGGTSLILAHTNADVDQLNQLARSARVKSLEIEAGQTYEVRRGRQAAPEKIELSAGDQIRFRETRKGQGINNGDLAIIEKIEGNKFTAAVLGSGERKDWRRVEFDITDFNHLSHGYAGTIYSGQGKTLDRTYLYYTNHWDRPTTYVALTRYRDEALVFANKKEIYDTRQMAWIASQATAKRSTANFITEAEIDVVVPNWRYRPGEEKTAAENEYAKLPPQSKAVLDEVIGRYSEYLRADTAYRQAEGGQAARNVEADTEAKARHSTALNAARSALVNARRLFVKAAMKAGQEDRFLRDMENVYFKANRAAFIGAEAIRTKGLSLAPALAQEFIRNAPVLGDFYRIYASTRQIYQVAATTYRLARASTRLAGVGLDRAAALASFLARNPGTEKFANTATTAAQTMAASKPAVPPIVSQTIAADRFAAAAPTAAAGIITTATGLDTSAEQISNHVQQHLAMRQAAANLENTIRKFSDAAGETKRLLHAIETSRGWRQAAEELARQPGLIGLVGEKAGEGAKEIAEALSKLNTTREAVRDQYILRVTQQATLERAVPELSDTAKLFMNKLAEAKSEALKAAVHKEILANPAVAKEFERIKEYSSQLMNAFKRPNEAIALAEARYLREVQTMLTKGGAAATSQATVAKLASTTVEAISTAAGAATSVATSVIPIVNAVVWAANIARTAATVAAKLHNAATLGQGKGKSH